MSKWTKDDLDHIARLARLRVDKEEVEDRLSEFEEILNHIETLGGLETKDVQPTTSLSMEDDPAGTPMDADQARESLDRDAALSNAPDRQEHFFRVPRFIEEGKGR